MDNYILTKKKQFGRNVNTNFLEKKTQQESKSRKLPVWKKICFKKIIDHWGQHK